MTLREEIRVAMLAIARREPIPPPRPLLIDEADIVACEDVPTDSIYFVSPRRDDDTDETWARRQGVIRNVGRPSRKKE
jgi:hypothetical protein